MHACVLLRCLPASQPPRHTGACAATPDSACAAAAAAAASLDTYTGATSMEVALLGVFCIDILVSFFVGFFDASGVLVMGHRAVAWQYAR